MSEGTPTRVLTDQLTEGQLEWTKLEDIYDKVVLGIGGSEERREYLVPSGKGAWEKSLIARFPNEENGIKKYFELVRQANSTIGPVMGLMKLTPTWLTSFLIWSGLMKRFFPVVPLLSQSLAGILESLFHDSDLKAVLAYSFGDYGVCVCVCACVCQIIWLV